MKELIAIQNELVVLKDQEKQGIKFKFRKCEQIFTEVKPLCKKYGVLLVVSDEMVCIGERYYIKSTATVSKDGHSESASGWAREPDKLMTMSYPQITGTCSSYARKYAMGGLFNLDDNQDPDTIDNTAQPPQKPHTVEFKKASPEQISLLTGYMKDFTAKKDYTSADWIQEQLQGDALSEEQASKAIKKAKVALS